MPNDYIETRPAACSSGVTCRECQEEVEWITFLADGVNVGVCACSWTTWMKSERKVFRSTTNEPGKR